jgi:hypothetical protein
MRLAVPSCMSSTRLLFDCPTGGVHACMRRYACVLPPAMPGLAAHLCMSRTQRLPRLMYVFTVLSDGWPPHLVQGARSCRRAACATGHGYGCPACAVFPEARLWLSVLLRYKSCPGGLFGHTLCAALRRCAGLCELSVVNAPYMSLWSRALSAAALLPAPLPIQDTSTAVHHIVMPAPARVRTYRHTMGLHTPQMCQTSMPIRTGWVQAAGARVHTHAHAHTRKHMHASDALEPARFPPL